MNASRICLAALSASLLAPLVAPLAAATHSYCHNGEGFPHEVTLLDIPLLNLDVSVDTGTNNGAHVLCVGRTGVVVDAVGTSVGPGARAGLRLCTGTTSCTTVLGLTGAAIGPGSGLTCTLGTCAHIWVNGVPVAP